MRFPESFIIIVIVLSMRDKLKSLHHGLPLQLKIQIIPRHLLLILNRLLLPCAVFSTVCFGTKLSSELWSILDRNSIYPLNLCLFLQELSFLYCSVQQMVAYQEEGHEA